MRTRTKIVEDENEKKNTNHTYIVGSHSSSSGPRSSVPCILCMKCVYKCSYLLHSAFGFPCLPSNPTVYISCNGRCRRTYPTHRLTFAAFNVEWIYAADYMLSVALCTISSGDGGGNQREKNASRILHSREHSDWARNTTYINCAGRKRDNVDVGDMESGAKGHSEDRASVHGQREEGKPTNAIGG